MLRGNPVCRPLKNPGSAFRTKAPSVTSSSRFKSFWLWPTFKTTSTSKGSQDNKKAKRYSLWKRRPVPPSRTALCLALSNQGSTLPRGGVWGLGLRQEIDGFHAGRAQRTLIAGTNILRRLSEGHSVEGSPYRTFWVLTLVRLSTKVWSRAFQQSWTYFPNCLDEMMGWWWWWWLW